MRLTALFGFGWIGLDWIGSRWALYRLTQALSTGLLTHPRPEQRVDRKRHQRVTPDFAAEFAADVRPVFWFVHAPSFFSLRRASERSFASFAVLAL
jgi:hypothetical protein